MALRSATHTNAYTHLCCAAHAFLALAGSHQQQVAVLVHLVVDGTGQTDFTRLGWDGEETARVDEQVVADWFILERYGSSDQEAGKLEKKKITFYEFTSLDVPS